MRHDFRSRLFAAVLFSAAACGLSSVTAHAQTPLLSGAAGTGGNTYYFVMDFRDFAAPQSYAFAYRSNAATLSFETILQGLTAVPTYSVTIATGSQPLGDSLNGFAYAGKTKFNDFNGTNSGQPNGYWSQWNAPNGTNWTSDQLGITNQMISAGQYVGASWTADFNTVADAAPRTPFASAATPEPGTFALLGAGMAFAGAVIVRRKKIEAGAMN